MNDTVSIELIAGDDQRAAVYFVSVYRQRSARVDSGRGGRQTIQLDETASNLTDALALAELLWNHAGRRLEEPDGSVSK